MFILLSLGLMVYLSILYPFIKPLSLTVWLLPPHSSGGGWVATEGRRTRQCSLLHGIGGAARRWAMGPACGLNGCPAYPGACAWSSIPQAPSEARCTQLGDSAGESSSPKLLRPLSTSLPTKDPRWYVGIQEKHTINVVAFPEH